MYGILFLASALIAHDAKSARPVDFDTEVVPVLTRAGCNSGACHGAAVGRGGFKLSLLGGDPARDHEAIVFELEGRRVNLARPDQSLLLAKPTEAIEHGGGRRLSPEGEGIARLRSWIAAGALRLKGHHLVRLDVEPTRTVVNPVGTSVPLHVTAQFDDGQCADATRWTVFTPSDPGAVEVVRSGTMASAVVKLRGQNVVVARFLDRVVPIQLIVPKGDRPVDLSREPRNNFVDLHVISTLETLRLPNSTSADDAGFLRRVRLDLTGRLPAPEEVRDFQLDRSAKKRERLVDRLLASDDFVTFWTFQLARLFRVRSEGGDPEGAMVFHDWLRTQVAAGAGFDDLARAVLTATGDSHHNGPANFYRIVADARSQAEYTAEVFLGVRLQCATVTTIRSIAGPRTITTAWRPSSPGSSMRVTCGSCPAARSPIRVPVSRPSQGSQAAGSSMAMPAQTSRDTRRLVDRAKQSVLRQGDCESSLEVAHGPWPGRAGG